MTVTATLRERDVKKSVYALLRGLGATVYDLSQSRSYQVTAGVPDAVLFLPGSRGMAWYEAKTPDGKQRPEQAAFQERCGRAGVPYVLGGLAEMKLFLRQVGIL